MEECACVVGRSESHHAKHRRCESLLLTAEVQCGGDEMLLFLLKVESRLFPGLGSACHSLQ